MGSRELAYGKDDPRVPGGTYYCGYWGEEYTVLSRDDSRAFDAFKVRWADGHVSEHGTAWEPWRDRVIAGPGA